MSGIDDFLLRAGLAGLALTLATGPLGAFVVWRRMAYFGDAMAHAAVLGVALGLLVGGPVWGWVVATALAAAWAVLAAERGGAAPDATLGVIAHSGLAFGLVAMSFAPRAVPLEAVLFGDILAIGWGAVAGLAVGSALVAGLVAWRWRGLLLSTLEPDLAIARGLRPERETAILTLALALTVAMAMQVVGALLIGALLVIPAAGARRLSSSPEGMAVMASLLGAVAVVAGLGVSLLTDAPAGPAIVAAAALVHTALGGVAALRRR